MTRKKVAGKEPAKKREKAPVKVIRRRNEKNEVVEIEVDNIPVEKAKVKVYEETIDKLLERRKKAQNHLVSITGNSLKNKALKEALEKGIAAIDKKIASIT